MRIWFLALMMAVWTGVVSVRPTYMSTYWATVCTKAWSTIPCQSPLAGDERPSFKKTPEQQDRGGANHKAETRKEKDGGNIPRIHGKSAIPQGDRGKAQPPEAIAKQTQSHDHNGAGKRFLHVRVLSFFPVFLRRRPAPGIRSSGRWRHRWHRPDFLRRFPYASPWRGGAAGSRRSRNRVPL